ncbi:MAG TPA: 1-deoxy-D-xylulose-5-phosphate reductoisomerase [Vicinamibacterales bacterium]|nr:1-deoxy-D-xylulose-5-phosphate reductoisomerase [Vicinamibacterales bacterium]
MKQLAILGSTGSIGRSALSVVDAHSDRLRVRALAAGCNAERMAQQIRAYRPDLAVMRDEASLEALKRTGADLGGTVRLACGADALVEVATHPDVDIVLCASSGTAALEAVLAAIEAGKTIALANKEVLVMAGELVTAAARRRGVMLVPVDSEHNAIHQCLHGRAPGEVRRIILTASGGAFRNWSAAALSSARAEDALRHPTWRMGPKITVDSATLMNKGLEVIEAHWLFGLPADRIDVVIHPQSIVHSLVELQDGSMLAQLGVTDMRLPIQYAFSYPERWSTPLPPLDLLSSGPFEFSAPDQSRFPCLGLAYRALQVGGSMPIVLNAANEVAVEAFLAGRLGFTGIHRVIERTMDAHRPIRESTLEAVREVDRWARSQAREATGTVELKA